MSIHRALFSGSLIVTSLLLAIGSSPAMATTGPAHVSSAESLLADLTASRKNEYASSPSYILWNGTSSQARTVCGTFITNLLIRSYNFTSSTFTNWLGTTSPYADTYYAAIVAQNNFTRIDNITQVQPGDIIAVKYLDAGTTGHAMLVDSVARAHSALSPIVAGTTQYAVTVIDSSSGSHGAADTRRTSPSTTGNGVGRGTIRVYVDAALKPVGYSWSDEAGSTYYAKSQRPLAIGRIALANFGVAAQAITGDSGAPMAQTEALISIQEDPTAGKTDDETRAAQGGGAPSDQPTASEASELGGCSFSAHPQAATPWSLALLWLTLCMTALGLRRRSPAKARQAIARSAAARRSGAASPTRG